MKVIPLLPFFDLYAGTYNQQALYQAIREVHNEDIATGILNRMTPHMLRVTTPAGSVVSDDSVLTRLRSNTVDVDLVLESTGLGDLGYNSCWAGDHYAIAFKHRVPPTDGSVLEKYYDPEPNIDDHATIIENDPVLKINLNDVFDHEAEGHGMGARAVLCAIVKRAQASQEWPVSEASMVNTLANISDRFETLRRQHASHHATLVIEMPAADRLIAPWSVTLGDAKPGMTFKSREDLGERFGQPMYQTQRHPQDRWPDLTNEGIVELLKCYALTQVTPFPLGVPTHVLPQGLDLLQLIQLRLSANGQIPFGYGHSNRPFGPSSHYQAQMENEFNRSWVSGSNGQQGFNHTHASMRMSSVVLNLFTEVTVDIIHGQDFLLNAIGEHFRAANVINPHNAPHEQLAIQHRFDEIRAVIDMACRYSPNLLQAATKISYVQRPQYELADILKPHAEHDYAGWMLVGRSDVVESDPMFVLPGRTLAQPGRPFPFPVF